MSERGIERKRGLKERERERKRKREEECLEDSPAQKDGYVGVYMSEKKIQRERALKICPQLLRMPKGGRKTLPCKKMDICVHFSFFFVSEKEIQRERVLKISPQLLHVHEGGRKTLPCTGG